MAEKIEFDLGVKNNQLDKALDSATKKASSLDGVLNTALGVFGGNVITKGFDLFLDGLGQVVDVFGDALKASSDNQIEINNLNSALSRAGILSKETSLELQGFADAIEATSTVTGGAVVDTITYLTSLTRLDKDGLQAATRSALDLSQALGIDLQAATTLVAKAANGNVSAFGRYGIEIQKGATDAETFANTLEKLNAQFGGAAASKLNTTAGAVTALGNAYEKSIEPLGDLIIQNPIVTATINEVKDGLLALSESVFKNKDSLIELVQDGILFTVASSQVLLDALDGITVVTKGLFNTLVLGANVITLGLVEPFKLAYDAVLLLLQNLPLVGSAFEGLQNPLQGLSDSLKNDVVASFEDLKNSADDNVFRQLSDGASEFADNIILGAERIKLANNEIKNSNRSILDDQDALNDEQLAKIAEFESQKRLLQEQFAIENRALNAELNEIGIQDEFARGEASIQRILDQKLAENQATLQAEIDKNKGLNDQRLINAANEKAAAAKQLADQKAFNQSRVALERLNNDSFLRERSTFLNTVATLSNAKSKELAAIGKAAAIVNATIAGKEAIATSFSFGSRIGGPPLGFTFAGIAAAASASQIASIAGVQFENGGVVGGANGGSVGPDNRQATIRDGEMVLNADQQKNLMEMLNNGGSTGDIVIQVDGRTIARAVRDQIKQGFVLA